MKHHHNIKKANILYGISIIAFFTGLHVALPVYFNSSFLGTFVNEKTISLIYLIISMVTIVGLLSMQTILGRFGNLRTSLALIMLDMLVFYQLINTTSPAATIFFFIISMSIVSLIIFTIDIFIQKGTDVGHTGQIRGLVMTATNTAWILGPLIGGMLIIGDNYKAVYIGSFALLFPVLYLIYKNFNNFKDSHYIQISARQTIIRILKDKDISRIFFINIILQAFYAWMTVYIPIYLHKVIGFSWPEISIMLTIMLIPFVLVDIPLGKLADKKWGEKELLAVGFMILAMSTGALFFLTGNSIVLWTIMLFVTRIGAATAEVMIETYFFKKVDGRDPEVLGMFRTTRPLSFFIAPLIVTIGLVYAPEKYLFLVFGLIFLFTLQPILTIRDTN